MNKLLVTGVLAGALVCGTAFGQIAQDTQVATPAPAAQPSLKLRAVIFAVPVGTLWLKLRPGAPLCFGEPVIRTWTDGRTPAPLSAYAPGFKTELQKAGYNAITPGEDNLFDPEAASADYEAAAVITDEHIEGCFSYGGLWVKSYAGDVQGDSSMKIDWQIYSPIKKQVVAHVSTVGTAHLGQATAGGIERLFVESFASNVAALASNTDFRAAMTAPKAFTAGFQIPGEQSKIPLSGSLKAGPQKIADAVGGVVTIMNDIGSGSGVLVSSDGYILTDAHVVGDSKTARVRWSDGIETLGEIVRVSKNRDVAILKTNPRDRAPLALKRGPLTPGQRVYAIGSPKGKDFHSTVSSGVVSADRVFDGLRSSQSDTMVSPGSSGGPLLDETGSVIGLTDLGIPNNNVPAGINLFTPIGDAMDFLALEQH
jgi:S1-C subfamily serine protease